MVRPSFAIPRVKMKIATHPECDLNRVREARDAIRPDAELYVDANGAYSRKQALAQAEAFHTYGVVWFEEPAPDRTRAGLGLTLKRTDAPRYAI